MTFWESGVVLNGLLLAILLLIAGLLRRLMGRAGKLGIPDSMVAGGLGLLLGPSALGWLPIDTDTLESLVYHGLAIVFIAVSLQRPAKGAKGGGARSVAFMIPTIAVIQAIIGVTVVLGFILLQGEQLHPGLGLLLPLGFQQGPGQALSMGQSWEPGLVDGAGVGLIVAALGFAWAVFVGVPLVLVGKRLGWLKVGDTASTVLEVAADKELVAPAGAMERLGVQVAAIAAVYLATLGIVSGISELLEGKAQFQNMIWGFHFIIAGALALGVRALLTKFQVETPLNDRMLGQIGGTAVDFVTCAALAAVNLVVFQNNLVLILVLTTIGGLVTVFASIWLARRAFPKDTFHHAVMMFGAVTGTLPTGLALLRILDPEMKSSAPGNAVLGSAGSLVLSVPLLLIVLPLATAGWPDDVVGALLKSLGVLALYLVALLLGWRFLGPLRLFSPLRIWPEETAGEQNLESATPDDA